MTGPHKSWPTPQLRHLNILVWVRTITGTVWPQRVETIVRTTAEGGRPATEVLKSYVIDERHLDLPIADLELLYPKPEATE